MGAMRLTFLGHVGFFAETRGGSVLCDPWFTPAYFGVVVPVPPQRRARPRPTSPRPTTCTSRTFTVIISTRSGWRATSTSAPVCCCPRSTCRSSNASCARIGFEHFVQTRPAEPVDLDGLTATILAFTTPADGPLGDSLIVIDDGTARVLNQNDARPGDPDLLRALGPFDAQIVQFSGAIWYPIVYDFPPELKARLAREKRVNQMARARQYIEWVDAAHVFPCAGPPAFLDDDLFAFNDVDRDPANIFPDQIRLPRAAARVGHRARRVDRPRFGDRPRRGRVQGRAPRHDNEETARPFTDKRAYLDEYARDWAPWLARERAEWSHGRRDLVAELAAWFEPLLRVAPITSAGIAGNVVLDVGEPGADVCIDFVESEVRRLEGRGRALRLQGRRRPAAGRSAARAATSRTG